MAEHASVSIKFDMENLKEYNGEKVKGDQDIFGVLFKDGAEIRIKSVADFEGFKCRIWAPEFQGILLDSAIRDAKEAEILRKSLVYKNSEFDGVRELEDSIDNTKNSYRVMQLAMSCMSSSINSVEAWINKIIQSEIACTLVFHRLNGSKVEWGANRIEEDLSTGEKIFNVIPAIFGINPIQPHVTSRQRFNQLISERNAIVHLKNTPKIGDHKSKRANLALKLLRRNSLLVPKNTISMIRLLHEKSGRDIPAWLAENIGALCAAESEVKKYLTRR
ncbi:MAG: hypothetical protein U1F46_04800 [Marinagarivorans sp.]